LLAQPDHFSKNLYVKAVAPGFQINLLLGFRELLDLVFDMLNAFDDSSQLIARNPHWSAHGSLLVNMISQKSAIRASASSRAKGRGKQLVNHDHPSPNPLRGLAAASWASTPTRNARLDRCRALE
jgi:hypothetical protein